MADFAYTYSPKEQEEVRKIREKYIPREENPMEKLRRLDAQAERPGKIWGLCLGTLGCLVFGAGMSLCLVWNALVLGIPLGLLGAGAMALAYPVSNRMTKKNRERIAPEILKLTEELTRG